MGSKQRVTEMSGKEGGIRAVSRLRGGRADDGGFGKYMSDKKNVRV